MLGDLSAFALKQASYRLLLANGPLLGDMGLLQWVTLAQGLPMGFTEALLGSLGSLPPSLPSLLSQQIVLEGIKRLREEGMLEGLYYVRPETHHRIHPMTAQRTHHSPSHPHSLVRDIS